MTLTDSGKKLDICSTNLRVIAPQAQLTPNNISCTLYSCLVTSYNTEPLPEYSQIIMQFPPDKIIPPVDVILNKFMLKMIV